MKQTQIDVMVTKTCYSMLAHTKEMLFIKSFDLSYVAASRSYVAFVGLTCKEEIIGKQDASLFSSEFTNRMYNEERRLLETGQALEKQKVNFRTMQGKNRWALVSKYPLFNETGDVIGLYGILETLPQQAEIARMQEYTTICKALFDLVVEVDLCQNEVLDIVGKEYLTPANYQRFSYLDLLEEVKKQLIHPDHQAQFQQHLQIAELTSLYEQGLCEQEYVYLMRKQKEYHWINIQLRLYYSQVQDSVCMMLFLKDQDQEIRHREILKQKAITDALTGLSNRESLMQTVAKSLMEEDTGLENALLFIDLDHFKQVNDQWGHCYGDEILRHTAYLLREIFSEEEQLGRMGGDEFVVFLKQIPSRAYALEKAKQVVSVLSTSLIKDEMQIYVSASVGIAMCRNGHVKVEQLYEQSDRAMYQAKTGKGKRVCIYDECSCS